MKATLLFRDKLIQADGGIVELVIWKLPKPTQERPHGIKYRLYYGDAAGKCLVRYDNEHGKGDHKHIGAQEQPYTFIDVDTLVADFLADVLIYGGTHDDKTT